jgi:hypothetical protein
MQSKTPYYTEYLYRKDNPIELDYTISLESPEEILNNYNTGNFKVSKLLKVENTKITFDKKLEQCVNGVWVTIK